MPEWKRTGKKKNKTGLSDTPSLFLFVFIA